MSLCTLQEVVRQEHSNLLSTAAKSVIVRQMMTAVQSTDSVAAADVITTGVEQLVNYVSIPHLQLIQSLTFRFNIDQTPHHLRPWAYTEFLIGGGQLGGQLK